MHKLKGQNICTKTHTIIHKGFIIIFNSQSFQIRLF